LLDAVLAFLPERDSAAVREDEPDAPGEWSPLD
jgi:hypothetical protein